MDESSKAPKSSRCGCECTPSLHWPSTTGTVGPHAGHSAVENRNFKLACQPSDPGRVPSPPCTSVFTWKMGPRYSCLTVPSLLYQAQPSEEAPTFGQPDKDSFLPREQGGLPLLHVDHSTSAATVEMQCIRNVQQILTGLVIIHRNSMVRSHFREKPSSKLTSIPTLGTVMTRDKWACAPPRSPLVLQEMFWHILCCTHTTACPVSQELSQEGNGKQRV